MRQDQVTQVRGYADQLLRVKSNPVDPSNRRISILVKNLVAAPADLKGAQALEKASSLGPDGLVGKPGSAQPDSQTKNGSQQAAAEGWEGAGESDGEFLGSGATSDEGRRAGQD